MVIGSSHHGPLSIFYLLLSIFYWFLSIFYHLSSIVFCLFSIVYYIVHSIVYSIVYCPLRSVSPSPTIATHPLLIAPWQPWRSEWGRVISVNWVGRRRGGLLCDGANHSIFSHRRRGGHSHGVTGLTGGGLERRTIGDYRRGLEMTIRDDSNTARSRKGVVVT